MTGKVQPSPIGARRVITRAEDLEIRKIYLVLPDVMAAKHRLVRVIDESGEDYLYPESLFAPVELPPASKRAFAASASSSR